uniref:Uncharacterized protein n=1 Tax=Arundo donax TaxID=35708 RepID=A0A0A9HK92_ARUDO
MSLVFSYLSRFKTRTVREFLSHSVKGSMKDHGLI